MCNDYRKNRNSRGYRIMTQKYFTILTQAGLAAIVNSVALGQNLALNEFVVGDGGGIGFDPDVETAKTYESIQNEVYRGAINELKVDPNNSSRYYIEGVVPLNSGGWTVREAAWYLESGEMFAYTKYPPSYKTIPADGVATELPIQTYVAVGVMDGIELKIDPTVVLATRSFVENSFDFIEVTGDSENDGQKEHVFTNHGYLQLKAVNNGKSIDIIVDESVDLSGVLECRVKAPTAEKLTVNGKQVDFARFTSTGSRYRFRRINGVWKV